MGGPTEFRYEVGGRAYMQRPLVILQYRQLLHALQRVGKPLEGGQWEEYVAEHLMLLLAVALVEDGKGPRDKDVEALAAHLEEAMTAPEARRAYEDFFVCNPLPELIETGRAMLGGMGALMRLQPSTRPSSSSAGAISPGGTRSAGDTPPPRPPHTSSTAPGTSWPGSASSPSQGSSPEAGGQTPPGDIPEKDRA